MWPLKEVVAKCKCGNGDHPVKYQKYIKVSDISDTEFFDMSTDQICEKYVDQRLWKNYYVRGGYRDGNKIQLRACEKCVDGNASEFTYYPDGLKTIVK